MALTMTLASGGLTALAFNNVQLLDANRGILVNAEFASGQAPMTETAARGLTSDTVTLTYSWGTVAIRYVISGNKLTITSTVHNTSSQVITHVAIRPVAFLFPSVPAEFVPNKVYGGTHQAEPSVFQWTYAGGAMFLASTSPNRDMQLWMPNVAPGQNVYWAVSLGSGWAEVPVNAPPAERDIAAGTTDVFEIACWFGQGVTAQSLMTEWLAIYRAACPFRLNWTDTRPWVAGFLSSRAASTQVNPRGYALAATLDVVNSAAAFRTTMIGMVDQLIIQAATIGAQGVIIWDLEGSEFPHVLSYIGAPNKLALMAPEMDAIANELLARITSAGLRLGLTLRPQKFGIGPTLPATTGQDDGGEWILTTAPLGAKLYYWNGTGWDAFGYQTGASQQAPWTHAEAQQILLDKVSYARTRWGASVFYVDSNVQEGYGTTPMPARIFEAIKDTYPDVLLIPEHEGARYAATCAPYGQAGLGGFNTGLSDLTLQLYPNQSLGLIALYEPFPADLYASEKPALIANVATKRIMLLGNVGNPQTRIQEIQAAALTYVPPPPPVITPDDPPPAPPTPDPTTPTSAVRGAGKTTVTVKGKGKGSKKQPINTQPLVDRYLGTLPAAPVTPPEPPPPFSFTQSFVTDVAGWTQASYPASLGYAYTEQTVVTGFSASGATISTASGKDYAHLNRLMTELTSGVSYTATLTYASLTGDNVSLRAMTDRNDSIGSSLGVNSASAASGTVQITFTAAPTTYIQLVMDREAGARSVALTSISVVPA